MKVSVLINTRNRLTLLKNAIDSALAQDFGSFEILVVDSGCTDTVEKLVASFGDDRIRYIKYDSDGLEGARNLGLMSAKGEYIAILDDDDVWIVHTKLRMQASFLDWNPEYVVVGTNIINVFPHSGREVERNYPQSDKEIKKSILIENPFCHSATMFRKELALDAGGYSRVKGLWNINEYELWLKLGLKGFMANLPIISTRYTDWHKIMPLSHRVKLYWKDFCMACKYRRCYSGFIWAIWRYWVKYPLRFVFRNG